MNRLYEPMGSLIDDMTKALAGFRVETTPPEVKDTPPEISEVDGTEDISKAVNNSEKNVEVPEAKGADVPEAEEIDTPEYNKDVGIDIPEGFGTAKAGSVIVLDENTFKLLEQAEEGAIVLGRISDEVSETTSQFSAQGVDESFEQDGISYVKADFGDITFSVSDSDLEAKTCLLSWTTGTVKYQAGTEVPENKEEDAPENKETEVPETKEVEVPENKEAENDDPATVKEENVPVTKGLSVEEQLYDEPMTWELQDIFGAFLTACYKLSISAEVNDKEPTPEQYGALIDEMAMLMKRVVGADADNDLAQDMTASFNPRNMLTLAIQMIAIKSGSRHNKQDQTTLKNLHTLLKELDESVCGPLESVTEDASTKAELETATKELAELQPQLEEAQALLARATELQEEVTRLETEVETKNTEIGELDAKIAAHQAVERDWKDRITRSLPMPDKTRESVQIDRLLRPVEGYKSYVDMTNEEFLQLRDKRY